MKVAFDGRDLSCATVLRGINRYTVGLVRELVRQGVRVTLFHREREPLPPADVAELGCDVAGLPDWSARHWEQVAVPLALWRGKFDLFHAPAERGVPWAAPCPVVFTIHSTTGDSYADLVRRKMLAGRARDYVGYDVRSHKRSLDSMYQHLGVARADHILTPSEFAREEVIRFLKVPPQRVTATPLAVHDQFRTAPHAAGVREETLRRLGVRRPYLLYVSGFERHKNVEGLLQAFSRVRAARPDLSLVLVGSKCLPEWVRLSAERHGFQAGREVVFLVNLTAELPDLYDAAELFVILSWRESFCLPALEAMTRGLPVVASAWGASPEVIGDAGRLVDPRDPAEAAAAILALLAAPDRADLSKRCRQAAQRFDWSRTAEQTRRIYARLIGRRFL